MKIKTWFSAGMVSLSLALGCPRAFAQWDYNQHIIDNIVEHRIDARKMRQRMEARRHQQRNSKTSRVGHKTTKRSAVSVEKVAALPRRNISILRDTYQDFHMNDRNGYVVTFTFKPTDSKRAPIVKSHRYAFLQSREQAQWDDLPAGTYSITASALYNGQRFPVQLGTRNSYEGSDFGPSVTMVIKPARDSYNTLMMQGFPDTIYLHVVEK